jgi:hypothetical protein
MNDDELDPGSRERLHRLLEESSGHPVPTGSAGGAPGAPSALSWSSRWWREQP